MKLVVNMIMGGMMTSFCEGLALGGQGRPGCRRDLLDVLAAGALANPMFAIKGGLIGRGRLFVRPFPLKHMQKDLRLAVDSGRYSGPVPARRPRAANEPFIRALD